MGKERRGKNKRFWKMWRIIALFKLRHFAKNQDSLAFDVRTLMALECTPVSVPFVCGFCF
jgi:predicted membrane-bound dolichyl-phosphate-mannose-protein mannosyltransferase